MMLRAIGWNLLNPYSETMYHLAVGLRSADCAIGLDFFESPFHKSPIVGLPSFVSPLPLVEMHHLLGDPISTQITINLTDPTIRIAMGFDREVLKVVAAQNGWTAVDYLRDTTTPKSITVELPSLGGNIESYDGISHKRRAIVAVIPSMTTSSNNLVYDPGFPTFVDLNNTFPILITRLECRLLSSFDDLPINLDAPGCSITFGIKQRSHTEPHV
jgi:hypothetical protein